MVGQGPKPHPKKLAQFELMVSYMEQHGDIQWLSDRWETEEKWRELTKLLNDEAYGVPKTMDKWRKCWSDLKNNTRKKAARINNNESNAELTDLEKRLLILMEENRKKKILEADADNTNVKVETDQSERRRSSTSLRFHINGGRAGTRRRESSGSSSSSSSSSSQPPPVKRKKEFSEDDKDITEKYLEFEREREKMMHEREMARVNQNEKLLAIFGRIVNVFETLAPSMQRYFDQYANENG